MKRLFCIALILLTLTACAKQQTMFLSQPEGARVTIDGTYVGTTPCNFEYNLSAGAEHKLVLEKDGYQPLVLTVSADETDPSAQKQWMAAGLIWSPLFLGSLFTKGMNDSFMVVMQPDSPALATATDY